MVPINNNSALVQIIAWRWSGDKPLSQPMMVDLTDTYMHHSAPVSAEAYFNKKMAFYRLTAISLVW